MAKKRFTKGLDSLFEETPPAPRSTPKRGAAAAEEAPRRRAAGKDFSADLSSFLQEAFEESFEKKVQKKKSGRAKPARKTRSKAPLSGLDSLIRSTLEPAAVKIDPKATRRMVVSFHEEQLAKLKSISRMEKTRLKKIINDIVEDYIQRYETENGEIP